MRKLFLIVVFCFATQFCNAQSASFGELISAISELYPGLVTGNHIVAVNVWSAEDNESREANKAFDKAAKTFEVAKLKGGTAGLISVCILKNAALSEARIILKKDGVQNVLPLNAVELKKFENIRNIVFDSRGEVLFSDLETKAIFSSIQTLITR